MTPLVCTLLMQRFQTSMHIMGSNAKINLLAAWPHPDILKSGNQLTLLGVLPCMGVLQVSVERNYMSSQSQVFSRRACRTPSVNFVLGFAGKFCGKFGVHLGDFFRTYKKVQKYQGKFRSIFREKIRSSKHVFVQTSFCRRATLSKCSANEVNSRKPYVAIPG